LADGRRSIESAFAVEDVLLGLCQEL